MSKVTFHFAHKRQPELAQHIEDKINRTLNKDKLFAAASWVIVIEYRGEGVNHLYDISENIPEADSARFIKAINEIREKEIIEAYRIDSGRERL